MFNFIKKIFCHQHNFVIRQDQMIFVFHKTKLQNVWRNGLFSSIYQYDGWWERLKGYKESCSCGEESEFKCSKREKETNPEIIEVLEGTFKEMVIVDRSEPYTHVPDALSNNEALAVLNRISGKKWFFKKAA